MATNSPPDWLQRILAPGGGNMAGHTRDQLGGVYFDEATQRAYMPITEQGAFSGGMDGTFAPSTLTGYQGYDFIPGEDKNAARYNGTTYDTYDPQGTKTGEGTWTGLSSMGALNEFLMGAAMMAAPIALTAAGAGAAGGAAGVGEAGWGMGLDSVTGGSGALEAMGAGGGVGAGGAAGGAGALSGAGGGASTTAASTVGGGSLLGKGTGALLSAAGGLLSGAGGGSDDLTATRRMDPRMDPYVYGNDDQRGLLQYVSQELGRAYSPERIAQRDGIRNTGMGLLQTPMAGNGFSLFSNRR